MTEVPGTQAVSGVRGFAYIGISGFANACSFAVKGDLPKIKLPAPKEACIFTLEEASEIASQDKS
jgi:hypothetical protein